MRLKVDNYLPALGQSNVYVVSCHNLLRNTRIGTNNQEGNGLSSDVVPKTETEGLARSSVQDSEFVPSLLDSHVGHNDTIDSDGVAINAGPLGRLVGKITSSGEKT